MRYPRLLAAGAGLTLLVTACGGDDGDTATSDTAAATAAPITADAAPTTEPATSDVPAAKEPDPTESSGPAASQPAGAGWSYTDGSGRTIELDERPERVVAHGRAASALSLWASGPSGSTPTPRSTRTWRSRTSISTASRSSVRSGASQRRGRCRSPTRSHRGRVVAGRGGLQRPRAGHQGSRQQLKEIAPIVGPAQGPSIVQMIEDYEALATSLGADLDDPAWPSRGPPSRPR